MAGTSSVSGLSSGIDWQTIIEKLRAVEQKKIDLVSGRKTTYETRLSAWQNINTKLLALKTAAETLRETSQFNAYSTSLSSNTEIDPDDVLSATASADAAPGTYQITVRSLASAQKLSSTSYASQTAALGLSGDILVGGRTVKIASTDSLSSLRNKINAVNSGANASHVTASIVNYGTNGYRIILTSGEEGSTGISLLNGGASDLLGTLGFIDAAAKAAKNTVTGGSESDAFSSEDDPVGGADLLNLTAPQSGNVTITINGVAKAVTINLGSQSLDAVRTAINTAFTGVFTSDPTSVVSETVDGTTRYRLLIEGNAITYADNNNVLETLGVLKRAGVSEERGVTGDVANTSGGAAITSSTLLKNIDGYNDYITGDTITLTGTRTSSGAVNMPMTITDTTTVGDLLAEIEAQYGEVTASLTADGKIQIVDNEIGDTDLEVILTPSKSSFLVDTNHNFGAISTLRSRQIQAGANADISVDGVPVTPSSNTVDDLITGVTLNLKKEADTTTVTLDVERDNAAIQEKITAFVSAYNETMDAINAQLSYDAESKKTGGPLFGDSTLRTIKSNLTDIVLNKVPGLPDDFSTPGLIGIAIGMDSKLTIDEDTLAGYLETNFDEVQRLFAADWSSTNNALTYVYHTVDTEPGTYNVQITGVGPVSGYLSKSGDASGNGEYLTGTSGDGKGLVVRYSGTGIGPAGSLTLTFGVAELLDRSLYHITDSLSGTIPEKEGILQNTIDGLKEDVDAMETRVDRKMEELERQFVVMETAMSQLQSQSAWLANQLDAAGKGWG
jgi:flagellar hook-associated protein 2